MNESQWTDAAPLDDVPADDVIGMIVDGRDIALYNVEAIPRYQALLNDILDMVESEEVVYEFVTH